MKHLVLGNSNLAYDLNLALLDEDYEVRHHRPDKGANIVYHIDFSTADAIWVAMDDMTHHQSEADYKQAFMKLMEIPLDVVKMSRPDQKIVLFSDACVGDEQNPEDLFAWNDDIKSWKQLALQTLQLALRKHYRQNVCIIRTSNLYGIHKPEQCLPGLWRMGKLDLVESSNRICPTPTDWLAEIMARTFKQENALLFDKEHTILHALCPDGSVRVSEFAKRVVAIKDAPEERLNPTLTAINNAGSTIALNPPHWLALYEQSLYHMDKTFGVTAPS